jgi:glucose-6-phosphate 1-epimerase
MTIALPSGATLVSQPGCGEALRLAASGGTAIVALHGATIVSFIPHEGPSAGRDLLWLSPMATNASGKALRGGVPICGPWFGIHQTVASAPAHGLMRNRPWALARVETLADGQLRAEFVLDLPAQRDLGWPHALSASFVVTVGSSLAFELSIRNTGTTPFMLSGAFHTYFACSDVATVRIEGLADREYIDFTNGGIRRRDGLAPVVLDRESARFYLSSAPVRLVDPAWNRAIDIRSWGLSVTAIWNPWDRTAATMSDLGPAWPRFICIEGANIPDTAVALLPGFTHHSGCAYAGSAV